MDGKGEEERRERRGNRRWEESGMRKREKVATDRWMGKGKKGENREGCKRDWRI